MKTQFNTDKSNIIAVMETGLGVPDLSTFCRKYSQDTMLRHMALSLQHMFLHVKSEDRGKLQDEVMRFLAHVEAELSHKSWHLEALPQESAAPLLPRKECVVHLEGIAKVFPSSNFHLKPVTLDLHAAEVTGIIGANGMGKSTLLRMIAGDLLPSAGSVRYPAIQGDRQKAPWYQIKQALAYIPQSLPEWSGNLRENLVYEAASHGIYGKECDLEVDFILERLLLREEAEGRLWHELSGGYKMRFALARALVWRPKLLVMDEPLAHLDVASQLVLLDDIKAIATNIRRPICVVLTTQHIHEVEAVADKLLLLDHGDVTYFGNAMSFDEGSEYLTVEFSTPLSEKTLREKLSSPLVNSLQRYGHGYILRQVWRGPNSATDLLSQLIQSGIPITYFRDITHSLKKTFYEQA